MGWGSAGCERARSKEGERAGEEQAGSDELGGGPCACIQWARAGSLAMRIATTRPLGRKRSSLTRAARA